MEHPFLPSSSLTPAQWVAQHQADLRCFWGPRDTRLPGFICQLAAEVCALRSGLEWLRLVFLHHPEKLAAFRGGFQDDGEGLHGPSSAQPLRTLVDTAMARGDWREQDLLEMILDYLQRAAAAEPGRTRCDPGLRSLAEELAQLDRLRDEDRHGYDRALQGLLSEARGNLLGLTRASRSLKELPASLRQLDGEALGLLMRHYAETLDVPADILGGMEISRQDPAMTWETLRAAAQQRWGARDIVLPLKPFEKASLFLLESLPVRNPGHRGFVRYLIEQDEAYRRLLATAYAPTAVRMERLQDEMEHYNRLPEHATRPVFYGQEEQEVFLFAFLFRPDAIAAIAEREQHKDIYRVVAGLGAKALLPRVLHETQNIFGYITPEAFQKVVEILRLDPVDVIRVIASYKQYSADRGGDIIVYLCKGTACFLRGQPELSRRLAAEIAAEEGEVGRHGIQFIEMDCFGVCHLAPVIKARDAFLGKRTEEDIARLLDQLLQGPSYENRMVFLKRIRRLLAPGKASETLKDVRIVSVIAPAASGATACQVEPVTLRDRPGGAGASDGPGDALLPSLVDSALQLDAAGTVYACRNGSRVPLGTLVSNSLAFLRLAPDGSEQLACVVMDDAQQVQAVVNFSAPFPEAELRHTLKPRAAVIDGAVWVERTGGSLRLGAYHANAIAVASAEGRFLLLQLSGPREQIPPAGQEGVVAAVEAGAAAADTHFVARQDRLVLGFTAQADPDEIESYRACGGYAAVERFLGGNGNPPWDPRDIVREITEARLRGRGGAGFPTGRKWEAVRLAQCVVQETDDNQDAIKLIVANGDEGDPGAFMDRTLIQERPHQVIEGMILAALAVGARFGVIYVRKEYEDAVRRLEHALFQARRRGYLGENIFATDGCHFDIDIRLGAGAFVAGEKRAIMRAIEGEPAEPTLNALSNTYRGLWGKPTLLNNVETFANVPLILLRGGKWYAQQGTERSGGSKVFSVAGIVKHTGLVEVRFGRTLHDIIRICGGIQDGKRLAGVQIGGPSGAILSLTGVRAYLLYTPLDFDAFDQVGAMLGSGGLVFIGEDDDVVRLARHFTDWLADESCGQCPACLQGTVSLGRTLDRVLQGEATSEHIHALWAKSDAIKAGSQCGLGMTAANPVTSALRFFPHTFLHYALRNPRMNRVELFRTLEALRLLTRGSLEQISGRRRRLVGHSFTLKKHLLRHLVLELEHLDQYRPVPQRVAEQFLNLLQVPAHEVGVRDVALECTLEDLENHQHVMWGVNYDPTSGGFARGQ
jgi:NADH:ubiquinone oxidoreductase subunit F (NADH-binding)/NADH:ubiquinone oxidoreductase subunit E